MTTMMWFRSDLRTIDNPALHAATSDTDGATIAVFTITPAQWRRHDDAPIKIDFILRNLRALSADLAKLNIALKILTVDDFAAVPGALLKLATEYKCNRLVFNRQYELNERLRDEATEDLFRDANISTEAFTDQCIFEPGDLRTGSGNYYRVFTPFKRSWCSTCEQQPDRTVPLPKPKKQQSMLSKPDPVPGTREDFAFVRTEQNHWPHGEQHAKKRLAGFLNQHAEIYNDKRDLPGDDETSRLSPYLTAGVISLRTCVHQARQANAGSLDKGSPGIVQWISELVWREFYKHILVGYPRVSMHRPFQLETERIRWNNNDDHFRAWCTGKTGYSIVDAAMRQLAETGWMHNRLRMITAMFLTKNLFLDWRLGEQFFMRHLIDGDLAANNGGWQWSASTGTDAAPYFRVFNPTSQSRKCDPQGEFIRRYIPELSHIEDGSIHEPHSRPPLHRSEIDYPSPIVDHATTRAKAIEAFKRIRS